MNKLKTKHFHLCLMCRWMLYKKKLWDCVPPLKFFILMLTHTRTFWFNYIWKPRMQMFFPWPESNFYNSIASTFIKCQDFKTSVFVFRLKKKSFCGIWALTSNRLPLGGMNTQSIDNMKMEAEHEKLLYKIEQVKHSTSENTYPYGLPHKSLNLVKLNKYLL